MNTIKKIISSSVVGTLLLPVIALADINPGPTPNGGVFNVVTIINAVLNLLWPIFFGYAVIMFIVAGFTFLTAQGEAEKVGEARKAVQYGAIGVVVGIIAFSLPAVIRATLGLGL